jgi:hypothetical protein
MGKYSTCLTRVINAAVHFKFTRLHFNVHIFIECRQYFPFCVLTYCFLTNISSYIGSFVDYIIICFIRNTCYAQNSSSEASIDSKVIILQQSKIFIR